MLVSLGVAKGSMAGFVLFAVASQAAAQNVGCAELDQVVAASTNSFKSISKKEDFFEDGDVVEWLPSVFLPGATKCTVDVEDGGSYTCSFKTAASPQTREDGPTNLSYVLTQFQTWVAKCAGFTGPPQFIDYANPLVYKGRYQLQLRTRPVWASGEIELTVRPCAD